jgi:hypothetical protein
LDEWECKALELSELAGSYEGALEENRRMFESMKGIIKEKDRFITEIRGQARARE